MVEIVCSTRLRCPVFACKMPEMCHSDQGFKTRNSIIGLILTIDYRSGIQIVTSRQPLQRIFLELNLFLVP